MNETEIQILYGVREGWGRR